MNQRLTSKHAPQAPQVQRVVIVLQVHQELWALEVARGHPHIVPAHAQALTLLLQILSMLNPILMDHPHTAAGGKHAQPFHCKSRCGRWTGDCQQGFNTGSSLQACVQAGQWAHSLPG